MHDRRGPSAGTKDHSEGAGAAPGPGLRDWRATLETLEGSEMTEYVIRFLVGGAVVSAFAMLGDLLRPKSFAGLFGAAPAVALAVYSVVVCHLLVRAKLRAVTATLLSLIVWVIVAFGLLMFTGGQA